MANDYYVISVESRKGGVGKTTAALNLAKLLIDKNYTVLFIDADITGTNVADSLNSPFWNDITNVIKEREKSANLLEWFDQKFMCGLNLPNISKKLDPKKINIIGSQIYNGEKQTNKFEATKKQLICSPSLLFDELHSFWFIEFIKKISSDFINSSNKLSVIIIDNSPGFVGIAPATHQWLTDIGPHRGKFLTISSLDRQDMVSCCHAVIEIQKTLMNKIESTKLFKDAMSSKDITLGSEHRKFFMRLVEDHQKDKRSKNSILNDLEYYFSLIEKTTSGDVTPSSYQNWIINRVPRELKKGALRYNIGSVFRGLTDEMTEVPIKILDLENSTGFKIPSEQLVCDDEYIEWQFMRNMFLMPDRYKDKHRRTEKIRYHLFDEIIERVHSLESIMPYELEKEPLPEAGRILKSIKEVQQIIETLVDRLSRFDYLLLTRLIRPEWYPMYPYNTVRDAFYRLIQESEYPPFEFIPFEYETGPVNEEAKMNMQRLIRHLGQQRNVKPPYSKTLRDSFVAIVSFLYTSPIWHFPYFEEFESIFGKLLKLQSFRFEKQKHTRNVRLQEFLVSEEVTEKDYHEMKMEVPFRLKRYSSYYFSIFYKSLCNAQARLIDLQKDAEFMVYVLGHVIKESRDELPLLPYIRPLFEDVIEKKTLTHEEGKKQSAKGFAEANYMEEFQKVLAGIVQKWRMIE